MKNTTGTLETGSGLPLAEAPAPTTKTKRTRKPAAKNGLVERLQEQLREARRISKAITIIATLSEFGLTEVERASSGRREEIVKEREKMGL